MTQIKETYFLSQPHQPFFILGVVNAIVMMLFFALTYKGVFTIMSDSLSFHVFSLVYLVFTNFFIGFLFTTFPRFCQSEIINKKYYTNIFYINTIATLIYLVGAIVSHLVFLSAMIILFFSQIYAVWKLKNIYELGKAIDKRDAFWILNGFYFSIVGMILFVFAELNKYILLDVDLVPFAINISFYMFLVFVAFSVGQRMIPFFSHSFVRKDEKFVKIIFISMLLKTLLSASDAKYAEILVDIFLALYMFKEFHRWKLPVFSSPAILWVLHIALFWLPLGFALSAMSLIAEILFDTSTYYFNVHLLAIGFLTTVLIGFGTRVTLGHSGQAPNADRFTTNLFWFIQLIVLARALFSFNIAFAWDASFLFDISLSMWLILFLLWVYKYAKVLVHGTK